MRDIQRGFTLIELMMVIAIVSILATIALPSYQAYVYRAKAVEVIALIDKIRTAIASLQAEVAPVGSVLKVGGNTSANQDSDPGLVYSFKAIQSAQFTPVPGIARSELNLKHLKIHLTVSSGSNPAYMQPGQFKIGLNVDQSHNPLTGQKITPAEVRVATQILLAVHHVMKPATYKDTVSSGGSSVGLYFQL